MDILGCITYLRFLTRSNIVKGDLKRLVCKMKRILHLISLLVLLAVPFLQLGAASAATTIAISSPTSGASVSGSSFTVTGTATSNRNITVKVNGTVVGTTTSDGSGNWSLNVSGQANGSKTVEATASYQEVYANSLNMGSPGSSVMSRINSFDDSVIGTFPIGTGGSSFLGWYPNPAFTKAYGVAGSLGSPQVYTIDLVNSTVSSFTMSGTSPNPGSAAFNADASKVYITDSDTSNDVVWVYNTSTDAAITSISAGDNSSQATYRPGTNEVWVTNTGDFSISVIDTTTDTVTSNFAMANDGVLVTFSPDGSRAYVTDSSASTTVDVYNASSHAFLGTIPLSTSMGIAYAVINSDGSRLYVSGLTSPRVDVLDTTNFSNLGYVSVSNDAIGLGLTFDDKKLYVASPNIGGGGSGTTISVINPATLSITSSITVAAAPLSIRLKPPEIATASVSFTVSGSLADTGINVSLVEAAGLGLVVFGLAGSGYFLRRRNNYPTEKV